MNWARVALSSVAALIAYFVYGGVVTGIFLKNDYLPYASVFRPADQIIKIFPFGIATTLLAIVVLTIAVVHAERLQWRRWLGRGRTVWCADRDVHDVCARGA